MTAQPERDNNRTKPAQTWPTLLTSMLVGFVVVAAGAAGLMWLVGGSDPVPQRAAEVAEPVTLDAGQLAELPVADTHATIEEAPADPAPQGGTDGTVVHPTETTAVFDEPGGQPFARIEPDQYGDTWKPVIDQRGDWVQVLLSSRPNHTTGWLATPHLEQAHTPYRITVHLEEKQLQLHENGEQIQAWPIGIGTPDTPTPTGRTYLMGSFTDDNQPFSPIILPLGSHSDTLDDFGGGPGTVAIHTWPTTDVLGEASSHGCIRVPPDALDTLAEVPLGTLVQVDQQ